MAVTATRCFVNLLYGFFTGFNVHKWWCNYFPIINQWAAFISFSHLSTLGRSNTKINDDTVPLSQIKLCKISSQPSSSTQPLVVTHSLLIDSDCTWQLFVYNHKVVPSPSSSLSMIPAIFKSYTIQPIDMCNWFKYYLPRQPRHTLSWNGKVKKW